MADQDPMAAVSEGAAFVASLRDQARKTRAYNALSKQYGEGVAYDPAAALKAQEYGQHTLTDPIAVDQAQADLSGKNLSNAGQDETNKYNVLNHPKLLAHQDLENTGQDLQNRQTQQTTQFDAQLQPGKVTQQGATLDSTRASTGLTRAQTAETSVNTQAAKFKLGTEEGAQLRQSAMGLLAGLSDTAANGGNIGAAFDRIAPQIAAFEGVDQAHLAPLRAQLLKDPVGVINSLSTAIHEVNVAAMRNTPTGALAQQKYDDQRAAQVQALGVTAQRTLAVPAATDAARALIPQMSSSAVMRKARGEIPGTPEYKYMQLVEQIKTNASLDDLRATRAGGLSLGRTTNTEFVAAGNALANLDLGQDPKMLSGNLSRLSSTYGVINESLQADVKRLSKPNAGGVVHVTAPDKAGDKPKYSTGVVYTDAQGNKATWDGAKFVPKK